MPRQERFCREFVTYANGSTAAKEAGYAPRSARQHASRLLKNPRIRARIAALQTELVQDAAASRDILLGKLETVYRRALADYNFPAAVRAVEAQARISGLAASHRLANPLPESMPVPMPESMPVPVPMAVQETGSMTPSPPLPGAPPALLSIHGNGTGNDDKW